MAQSVLTEYDGQIPHNQKELMKLAGVGNKTANVFMIEFEGANLMAVAKPIPLAAPVMTATLSCKRILLFPSTEFDQLLLF